jgi:hypothetical protein
MRLFILMLTLCLCVHPAHAVNLSKGQSLACGAILCGVGIVIPESRSECTKVLRDWSIYVATLGPFRSKPRCPILDKAGATAGYNAMECSRISDPAYRQMCEEANNTKPAPGFHQCNQITDGFARFECENSCDDRYRGRDGGIVCQIR